MAFTSVKVTHTFQDGGGNPLSGYLVFKLNGSMTNGVVTIEPTDIVVQLDQNGSFAQWLLANDDTATVPASPLNVRWQVFIELQGAPQQVWTFTLSTANAPAVDLFALLPSSQQVN